MGAPKIYFLRPYLGNLAVLSIAVANAVELAERSEGYGPWSPKDMPDI